MAVAGALAGCSSGQLVGTVPMSARGVPVSGGLVPPAAVFRPPSGLAVMSTTCGFTAGQRCLETRTIYTSSLAVDPLNSLFVQALRAQGYQMMADHCGGGGERRFCNLATHPREGAGSQARAFWSTCSCPRNVTLGF